MSTINIFQISLEIWGCIISILVCMLLGTGTFKTKDSVSIRLWAMLLVNNILLGCDALAYIYRGDTTALGMVMTRVSNYGLFALEYILLALYVGYVRQMTNQSNVNVFRICYGIILIITAGLVSTPFTGLYFTFDPSNHYMRGSGIALSFIGCGIVILLCVWKLYQFRKQFDQQQLHVFIGCILILLACIVIQFLFYGLSLINIGLTIILLLLYIRRSMEQYRQEIDHAVNEVIEDSRILTSEKEADDAQNKE